MKARTFASVAVMGALGLLAPVHSYAFGLGKIELSSALNEPFQAAIPVTALRDEGELRVQLASNLEFEKAGLKRSFLLTQLNFEVVEDEGVTRILISSSQPIKEPFIDFLVTATTGNGRLIREYTVLLDPPKNIFVKPQSTSSTKQKTTVSTKTAYQSPASKTPVTSTSHYSSATSYGPIERTDTLWDIAKDTKPDANISQNQMMMAILNANPESFRNNNINGLKVGGTLDIPTVEVTRELSRSQAFTAVKEQNSVWKNRNKKSEVVSDTIEQEEAPVSLSEEESPEQTESLEPEAIAVEDNGETSGAQLKLLVPTEETLSNEAELSPLGDSQLTQLNDQLSLAQETIEGQVQENVEMKARMEIMEEQIQTLRRLVTLKDADLAVVQSAMQSEVEEYFTQLETNEELSPDSDDELLVDSELLSEENDVEPSSDTELVEQGDTSAQLPLEVAAGTINSALEKLKSFYAENKQESLIAGLLAFLGLLFLSFRSRRNQKYTWDDAVAAADVEESSHRNAKSSVISDSQETPVGEEEEIIKAAYASLGDDELVDTELNFQEDHVSDIESEELNDDVEIAAIEEVSELEAQIDTLDLNVDELSVDAEPEVIEEQNQDDNIADDLLDFNIDSSAVQSESPESHADVDIDDAGAETLEFDAPLSLEIDSEDGQLTLDEQPIALEIGNDLYEESTDEPPLDLDLPDFKEDESSLLDTKTDEQIEELRVGDLDEPLASEAESDVEFDLGNFDEIDEAETKLDLASAYMDMGDPEGARNILEEVLADGNSEQKEKAQSLLNELS